jgi:hypothetical protein
MLKSFLGHPGLHHTKINVIKNSTYFAGRFNFRWPWQSSSAKLSAGPDGGCPGALYCPLAARVIVFGTHKQGCGSENGSSKLAAKRLLTSLMPQAS